MLANSFFTATGQTAQIVYRDEPTLRRYFRGPDRVEEVRRWIEVGAAQIEGIDPEKVDFPALRVWTPLGRPPEMTSAEFARLELAARAQWREDNNGREPKDVDMWVALSMSRAKYYRLKGQG